MARLMPATLAGFQPARPDALPRGFNVQCFRTGVRCGQSLDSIARPQRRWRSPADTVSHLSFFVTFFLHLRKTLLLVNSAPIPASNTAGSAEDELHKACNIIHTTRRQPDLLQYRLLPYRPRNMKTHTRPSPYSPTPFHITNIALFVSSTIVTSILVYFCAQLKNDDFKLPWTFIVVRWSLHISRLETNPFRCSRARSSP